jgi:hypothetical protein
MKEIVHIHVGNAGIRIGAELWKLYSFESPHCPSLFEELKEDRWQPRSLVTDLDYMTIN